MKKLTLESYRKPLLELVETETADICAASPKIVPGTTPFESDSW